MVDGAASLMLPTYEMYGLGVWDDTRGSNLLDGGAPFYGVYEAADGKHLAVGPIEPQFFAALAEGLGIGAIADQYDPSQWENLRKTLEDEFAKRTRDEWVEHFTGSDACVTPILSLAEAPGHAHNKARGTFVEVGGLIEPAPAPRFDRNSTVAPHPPRPVGADTMAVLREFGFSEEAVNEMIADEVLPQPGGHE